MTQRMPAIYLSHGAPPLADDTQWTRQLADWSRALPSRSRYSWSPRTGKRPRSRSAATSFPCR